LHKCPGMLKCNHPYQRSDPSFIYKAGHWDDWVKLENETLAKLQREKEEAAQKAVCTRIVNAELTRTRGFRLIEEKKRNYTPKRRSPISFGKSSAH